MNFGAKETPTLSRPPDHPVDWIVWPKGAPDEHGAVVVRAQLWSEARAEGCKLLGVSDVDGRRVEVES